MGFAEGLLVGEEGESVMSVAWKSRWRRGTRKVCLAWCGLVFLGVSAFAQPQVLAPVDSDLAVSIHPESGSRFHLAPEVWREQPLLRALGKLSSLYFDIDFVEDFQGTLEGTFVAATLRDEKGRSTITAYVKDQELRDERQRMVTELRELARELEVQREDGQAYPTDIEGYLAETRGYEPSLPDGVSMAYETTQGGKGFQIKAIYESTCPLKRLGPAPIFRDGAVIEHEGSSVEEVAPRYVFGAKLTKAEPMKAFLTKLYGDPQGGFWSGGSLPLQATVRGDWLLVGDDRDRVSHLRKVVEGKADNLSKSKDFQRVVRYINKEAPVLFYADLPRLLAGARQEVDLEFGQVARLLGPAALSTSIYPHAESETHVFVSVVPPKGSALAKCLAGAGQSRTAGSGLASSSSGDLAALDAVPWDVSDVVAFDYRQSRKLFSSLVALSPRLSENWETLEDLGAGFLGIDAAIGFDGLAQGWMLVSYDRLGYLVNMITGFFDFWTQGAPAEIEGASGPSEENPSPLEPEDGTSPVIEVTPSPEGALLDGSDDAYFEQAMEPGPGSVDSSAQGEVEEDPELSELLGEEQESSQEDQDAKAPSPFEAVTNVLKAMPVTVAIQVADSGSRGALVQSLMGVDGGEGSEATMSGVPVKMSAGGWASTAEHGPWLYLSSGRTQRLLRNFLATASGQKESLASLESWVKFRSQHAPGAVMLAHQKIDVSMSIAKAFLLYMGPEFRPLAQEVGGLRDVYAAGYVVPDGFLIVSKAFRGDGR